MFTHAQRNGCPIHYAGAVLWFGHANELGEAHIHKRIADMTTSGVRPHTHPELQSGIETTQAMIAQLIAGQATILDTLNAQAENQARMQESITAMQGAITALINSQVEMQAAIGELARALAVVQADVALLLARDS